MAIYITILLILIICALCFKKTNANNFFVIIISAIIFILFAGLRYDNADWYSYVEMFNDAIHGYKNSLQDSGFIIFLNSIGKISVAPVFMFLCVAAISVTLNINSFQKYTPYVFLAILLYFVHNYVLKEMIQIRVGLSSSICLFSIRYFPINKYKRIIILWIISMSIHLSTGIFGILILLYKLKPTKRFLLYSLLLSLIIGTFCPLGSIIKTMLGISDKLDAYIAFGSDGYASSLGVWNNLNLIKTLFFFCLFYYYNDLLLKRNKFFYVMFLSYTIGLCWLLCFNDFAIIGARMSNIMLSVEPVLLTLPLLILKKSEFFLYKICLIGLSIFMFVNNITPDKITPYRFYLDYI